ncbi:MAG: right-handed parallel beta-helix repeat-containing protein [Thermocrispum agreste]|uniref:Right-handed parallel beta-helix repeat-containing protein n=1 Tax=Thermocrispum agreste TaxID=37925 RepID=A0A2W4JPG4_9PSEU|nr:MAG: hypothetical protein DIU77_02225 [Thermocrispum agreste]
MPVRPSSRPRPGRFAAVLAGVVAVTGLVSCTAGGPAPDRAERPIRVCDRVEPGPASPPGGAVVVQPGVDDVAALTRQRPAGTTFWLAEGVHTLGGNEFAQIVPKKGNAYLGAPGAVLDGKGINRYAVGGKAERVTVRHLTVRNFVAPGNESVVNHDSADHWVVEHNTISDNGGAALAAGAHQRIRFNCLRDNGQYGINAYQDSGTITGLVVHGNEITGNNTDDWEARIAGCGCTGGAKFWAVDGADVTGNWVHHNHGPGLWADTNNNDFVIRDNVISDNEGPAIIYETSYNAVIAGNTILRNNWADGRRFVTEGDPFPVAAVYVSESGGEPRVPARTDKLVITGNRFTDNWSGITLWENADRFCNSPHNTSSGYCTLLVDDVRQCRSPAIQRKPLLDDCRWKTKRVDIHHNRFEVDPVKLGCEHLCARMAVLANFGTSPAWSPYHGASIQQAITWHQGNEWHDNVYVGPWRFMAYDTSRLLEPSVWQSAPHRQDRGSVFSLRAEEP